MTWYSRDGILKAIRILKQLLEPMIEFWMVIALILTGSVVIIAYYFAMMLKEIVGALREMKGTIQNLDKISSNLVNEQKMIDEVLNSAKGMAKEIEEGFTTINEQIIAPFSYIGTLLQSIKKYLIKNGNS